MSRRIWIIAALSLALAGCGGGGGSSTPTPSAGQPGSTGGAQVQSTGYPEQPVTTPAPLTYPAP